MGLEDLQALVLDEADRLLQMGFAEEVWARFMMFAWCLSHSAQCTAMKHVLVDGEPLPPQGQTWCCNISFVRTEQWPVLVQDHVMTVEVCVGQGAGGAAADAAQAPDAAVQRDDDGGGARAGDAVAAASRAPGRRRRRGRARGAPAGGRAPQGASPAERSSAWELAHA